MAQLTITRVAKTFNGTRVLHPLDLTVGDGAFCCMLGSSGSGKSTLLRIIAGLEDPDDGSIRVGSREITRLPVEKRNIGFVFQNYALFPHLSVLSNVMYGLRARHTPRPAAKKKAEDMLTLVGLGDFGGCWLSRTRATVECALEPSALRLRVRATNVGDALLPIGIGWHPYFALPSGDRAQARLRLPAHARAEVGDYDEVLPTGRTVPGWVVWFPVRSLGALLPALDEMEGIGPIPDRATDPYVRIRVPVDSVTEAWAYHATHTRSSWRAIDAWVDQAEA